MAKGKDFIEVHGVERFPDRGEYIESFLDALAKELGGWLADSWRREEDPVTGVKWKPRRPPTGDWPILRKTGAMQDTAKRTMKRRGNQITTRTTEYGPKHQTGTNVPLRRWVGPPVGKEEEMEELLARAIIDAIELP